MRYLLNLPTWSLLAATFLAAMAPLATTTESEPDWSAEAAAMVDQQVAAMTAGRDSTTTARLVDHVIVRNARLRDGNTAVARWVTFDQAFAAASKGDVVVLRYCA
jgi:hypothetical protein